MIYINHRVNQIIQKKEVPLQNGAEIDVRYHNNDIILHHDPFNHHKDNPQKLESFLKNWKNTGPIVLNLKTEGIEKKCIDFMRKYQIKDWFFLDMSMPFFVFYSNKAFDNSIPGFSSENLAVRFSEYEPIEYALSFSGKAKWVWVDCFNYLPINKHNYKKLKLAGFKICLVSPELQKHNKNRIIEFKKQCLGLEIDAVCTKYPDFWKKDLFNIDFKEGYSIEQ